MKDEEEDDELMLMETTGQKQTDATTQEEMETLLMIYFVTFLCAEMWPNKLNIKYFTRDDRFMRLQYPTIQKNTWKLSFIQTEGVTSGWRTLAWVDYSVKTLEQPSTDQYIQSLSTCCSFLSQPVLKRLCLQEE